MGIIDFLKRSEQLVFWNRCRIHRKKADFREWVLDGYHNADYIRLRTFGSEYEGRTIYLVDEQGHGMGFFAELGVTLIKLYFADERGFTPYIHWGERYLYYEPDGMDGEKNAYLYFFKPASEVESIDQAMHVVYSEISHYEQVKKIYHAVSYDVSDDYINAMARMMKKYVCYNDKTAQYLESSYDRLLGTKKTVGVHFRGTDFRKQYNNHPVAVEIEQEIEKVKELLQNKGYEQIFLATDEENAVRKFREAFGDKVKVYEDTYRETDGDESIAFSEDEREHHRYKLALEVLRDEYTLTRCSGLVCGYSNVTFIARIMRRAWYENDFEDYVLINNGIYKNNNSFGLSGHGREGR